MIDSSIITEKEILLINEPDRFVLMKKKKSVSISKSLNPSIKEIEFDQKKENIGLPIDGVIGVLEAKDTNYLMVISSSNLIGTVMGHKIFLIKEVSFFSYDAVGQPSKEDKFYIKQVKDFFARNTFYYSPTFDLSVSFYSLAKSTSTENFTTKLESKIFQSSQHDFIWNFHNTRILDNENLINIIHPIINGFIGLKSVNSYNKEFTFCLISRKETKRSGCRFLVRGSDFNGNVANFAETEEFIVINESSQYNILSYLQVRGSIPLIWAQLPNLKLNPKINPSSDQPSNNNAFCKHFTNLINKYDKVTIVNLIDKKGDQQILGEHYQFLFQQHKPKFQSHLNNNLESLLDYTWFDFHSECKKMRYDNLSKLLKAQSIQNSLSSHDFTHLVFKKDLNSEVCSGNFKVMTRQVGVFRTNCIDNLDRTNVVQSVLGRQFLLKMLYRLKLSEMPHGNPFEEFVAGFEQIFRFNWGDNGDYLSKAYSGTNALKRDFTRTGKRTIKGSLDDLVNTTTRFYINNFCDGYNQDCHDYYLGYLNPKKKNFKPHSTFLVNCLLIGMFLFTFLLYEMSINFSFPEIYETNWRKSLLKTLIFCGIFLMSSISLFKGFENSIIDLSTIPYH